MPPKSYRPQTSGLRIALLLALVSLGGCDLFASADAGDSYQDLEAKFGGAAEAVDFGFGYAVLTSPTLAGGALVVPVQFGGGCVEHDFALHYRVEGGQTEVWIHHDNKGDGCQALLRARLHVQLPATLQSQRHLTFLTPEQDTFTLQP